MQARVCFVAGDQNGSEHTMSHHQPTPWTTKPSVGIKSNKKHAKAQ